MQIEEDFEIKNHTSFKIGGKIKKIFFPETVAEFEDLLKNHPVSYIAGNLSNTLVSSFGYSNTVISTSKLNNITINDNLVTADAGVKGPKLAQEAAKMGLSGLEFMIGFPGSVGGEVFMNAGAHSQCIADCFKSAKIYDGNNILTLNKSDMCFSYRKSVCEDKKYIILQAKFELERKDKNVIEKQMTDNLNFRKAHQPSLALPNCGSIFKNPENNSAGKLLDECGVKDLQVGGARVWQNHANFIVNFDNAKSSDVLELMKIMKTRVFEKFGIELEPEIRFLGSDNNEVELCKYLKVK